METVVLGFSCKLLLATDRYDFFFLIKKKKSKIYHFLRQLYARIIINYISKSNVDQAIEVLETFYFYYYRSIEKRSNFGT